MKCRPYPKYKSSGIEWLGDVPADWYRRKIRYCVELNPSKSEISSLPRSTEVSFLPMEAIGDDGKLQLHRTKPIGEVESGYTYFRNGDITIAKITPCFENGKGALMNGLLNGVGFGTTELIVVRPGGEIHGSYLQWLFQSTPFRKMGEGCMYGAGGQKRVPDDFVRDFEMAWPCDVEQEGIVVFLDRETAKIDTLIAKQEKLIELLKEKRQAVISHAVTKGIDPTVPMKASGVEWLGDVPEHWIRTPIKHVLLSIIDSEHKTAPYRDDGEYFVVRTTNIKGGTLVFDGAKHTDREGYDEWTQRGVPCPGDILLTREAPAGEACLVPVGIDLCLGQRIVLLKVNPNLIDSNYGLWSLYGGLAAEFIEMLSQGSTVAHFNMSDIANIPIFRPSLEEQLAIVAFLREVTVKIDLLIMKSEDAIALQKEHRTALISAAVTGKIDVREAASELQEAA